MFTIACVLKSGGIYDATWVQKLRNGVVANMPTSHRFVCLTDTPMTVEKHGVEAVALANGWPGWWSKIELFRPGLLTGPTLYLDLDMIVTGALDDLVRRKPGFTMCADFYRPEIHNSSAMSWRGDFSEIYRLFSREPASYQASYKSRTDGRVGDQAMIEDVVQANGQRIDTFKAGRVVSYKAHARYDVPDGASLIAFHGSPKMHEINGWVAKLWNK